MYTKTISVNTNWLDAIDGKTVADAIAYLQTLNSEYILTYSLEGDTHGCTVESFIEKQVPMTNKEILEKLIGDFDENNPADVEYMRGYNQAKHDTFWDDVSNMAKQVGLYE